MFPPIPTWDALHPLVVHFPIALLLIAPLLVLGSLAPGKVGTGISYAALGVMALGTIAAWVAVATGEAAGELAERTPGVAAVLERHEELAELVRTIFTVLTGIFAGMVLLPLALRRELPAALKVVLHGAFLVLYLGGAAVLANTAHQGGLLVHEYGVRAMVSGGTSPQPQPGIEEDED